MVKLIISAVISEDSFYDDFYHDLASKLDLATALDVQLPHAVYAASRENESTKYVFIHNFSNEAKPIPPLDTRYSFVTRSRAEASEQQWTLAPYEVIIVSVEK